MSSNLAAHDGDRTSLAGEVDGRIRSNARSFVQFGMDLMLMRDGQLYRDLPGHEFASFEDYLRTVEDLSIRRVQEVIVASLTYTAIESMGATSRALPATSKQCRALIESGVVKVEYREVDATTSTGKLKVIKQPIGIKNSTSVAKAWQKACKAYDKYADKYRAENEGKEPRPMSYTFIRKQFPGGERLDRSKDTTRFASVGRALAAFTQSLRGIRDRVGGDLIKLMDDEEWTDQHRTSLAEMMHAATTELDIWMEAMTNE